jgi:hypothetical protein
MEKIMDKHETKLNFQTLVKRHGAMEAMRILETLENMAYFEERKKTLLAEPADRFVEAMTRLMMSDVAA